MDDEKNDHVDRKHGSTPATIREGSAPVNMSRAQISEEVKRIGSRRSHILHASDVDFLTQVDRTHPQYGEANRILANYYYKQKDYRRQIEALEAATARGRFKHDPQILLSLGKAYALRKRYRKAMSTMVRVESKMRRLPSKKRADAYRFFAEILEFEFLRQHHEDSKRANVSLIDKSITKWERYRTFARGSNSSGVAKANQKIKELNELKSQVEL